MYLLLELLKCSQDIPAEVVCSDKAISGGNDPLVMGAKSGLLQSYVLETGLGGAEGEVKLCN